MKKSIKKENRKVLGNFYMLDRGFLWNGLWLEEEFSKGQALLDLMGNVSYGDRVLKVGSEEVEVKRGQIVWSERFMGERWKWSRDKVRKFIERLEKGGILERKVVAKKNHKKNHPKNSGITLLTLLSETGTLEKKPQKKPNNNIDNNKKRNTIYIPKNFNKEDILVFDKFGNIII